MIGSLITLSVFTGSPSRMAISCPDGRCRAWRVERASSVSSCSSSVSVRDISARSPRRWHRRSWLAPLLANRLDRGHTVRPTHADLLRHSVEFLPERSRVGGYLGLDHRHQTGDGTAAKGDLVHAVLLANSPEDVARVLLQLAYAFAFHRISHVPSREGAFYQ